MYLEHFGLASNPFSLSPKLNFLYKSTAFEESMAHLIYGLDNSEAIVMITGAIGSGKTMSLQSFMANLRGRFEFALVTNTQVTAIELLKLVLDDLEVSFPSGCDKSDLLILFKEYLFEASRSGRRVIIIVDEAQNLSFDVLEEVRLLTNLGQGESQPVQIVLVGQPELLQVVNDPRMAQLRQRIRVHYSFESLTRKELADYLIHRLSVAGCRQPVFRPSAVTRIYELSGGIPRVVNALAGGALLSAFVAGHGFVEEEDVEPLADSISSHVGGEASAPLAPPEAPRAKRNSAAPAPVGRMRATDEKDVGHQGRRWGWGLVVVFIVVAVWIVLADPAGIATWLAEAPRGLQHDGESSSDIGLPVPTLRDTTSSSRGTLGAVTAISLVPNGDSQRVDAAIQDQADTRTDEVPVPALQEDRYVVHVASFKDDSRAESYKKKLGNNGFSAMTETRTVNGALWHRVYLGPFISSDAAVVAIDSLKKQVEVHYYRIQKLVP